VSGLTKTFIGYSSDLPRATLDLNFAENKSLVDNVSSNNLVTFTRASAGTYVHSDGLVKTATTNLLLRSEEFGTTWVNSASTNNANVATAPNGTLTADEVVENNTNAQHRIEQQATKPAVSLNYVFSVYVKRGTGTRNIALGLTDGTTGGYAALFDPDDGTVVSSSVAIGSITGWTSGSTSSTLIGNGWWRFSFSVTSNTATRLDAVVYLVNGTTFNYLGDSTSNMLLWGAQLEQSSTVGEYIPTTSTINSAPRFDHNPATGESLGLLVEEQRTNSIRNNTMVGAVAGTPGTLPTNWSGSTTGGGVTREIVGTGTENGITYIDIKVSGTTTGALFFGLRPDGSTAIAASNGQTWTFSNYVRLIAGSFTGITQLNYVLAYNDVGGTPIQFVVGGITPTSAALNTQRFVRTGTATNAATAFVQGILQIEAPTATAINITLRIGLPQLEQGAFATSVIPTTGTAVTRSADVASITGTNFSSWYRQDEGTVFAEARTQQSGAGHILAGVSTGSFASSAYLSKESDNLLRAAPDAAPANLNITLQTVSTNVLFKCSLAFTAGIGSASAVMNGGMVGTDASTGIPTIVDRLAIGCAPWNIGTTLWNGTIRRLTYWPTRLSDTILQNITK